MLKTLRSFFGLTLLALLGTITVCLQPYWSGYQVIMWSTEPVAQDIALWFQRLRELEFTAEQCYRGRDPTPFVQHKFGFYVENLVPQLAFHHNRRKLYDEDFRNYTQTRNRKFLVRKPCFDDPSFWDEIEKYLSDMVRRYAPSRPLFYNLQDEPSIGAYENHPKLLNGRQRPSPTRRRF